jgi:hypothetical protein
MYSMSASVSVPRFDSASLTFWFNDGL